jgi:hypothetical protein
MLSLFETKQQEEFAALGSLKAHQEYLMKMIDTKNLEMNAKD